LRRPSIGMLPLLLPLLLPEVCTAIASCCCAVCTTACSHLTAWSFRWLSSDVTSVSSCSICCLP
jgi:hypothetical protein